MARQRVVKAADQLIQIHCIGEMDKG